MFASLKAERWQTTRAKYRKNLIIEVLLKNFKFQGQFNFSNYNFDTCIEIHLTSNFSISGGIFMLQQAFSFNNALYSALFPKVIYPLAGFSMTGERNSIEKPDANSKWFMKSWLRAKIGTFFSVNPITCLKVDCFALKKRLGLMLFSVFF